MVGVQVVGPAMSAMPTPLLLAGIATWVLIQAVGRWSDPPDVSTGVMLGAAVIGGVADAVSLLLLREATPRGVDMEQVRRHITAVPGVVDVQPAACLTGHFDVDRCTFQLEPVGHREREASHHR